MSGFTSGDGGFFVRVFESLLGLRANLNKLGLRVQLRYEIAQDRRDKQLMYMLITFFGCGTIYQSGTMVKFCVFGLYDILTSIIPFFSKYPVAGVKFSN